MPLIRRTVRPLTAAFAFGLSVASGGSVAAQAPPMPAITQLDNAVRSYITTDGSFIARQGTADANDVAGRAIPCRRQGDDNFVLASSSAYPLLEGEKTSATPSSLRNPLVLLAQGTLTGQVGAGGITANGSADKLSRLEAVETMRVRVNDALGASAIRDLQRLNGTAPGYDHWCIVRNASVWRITYEAYDKKDIWGGLPEGLWIITANGRYLRNASAVVPYHVITLGVQAYPVSWVQAQSTTAPATSPPPATAVAALSGALDAPALARGDELRDQRVSLEMLLAQPGVATAPVAQNIRERLNDLRIDGSSQF